MLVLLRALWVERARARLGGALEQALRALPLTPQRVGLLPRLRARGVCSGREVRLELREREEGAWAHLRVREGVAWRELSGPGDRLAGDWSRWVLEAGLRSEALGEGAARPAAAPADPT